MPMMGARNAQTKNARAITMLDRPVRAPAAAPEVDSANEVMELAPTKPPTMAPTESTMRISRVFSTLPSSSTKPPCWPTAIIVPMVSKKSLMSRLNTNMSNTGCTNTCTMARPLPSGSCWNGAHSALKSGTKSNSVGSAVTPSGMPTMVATTMEMSRPPFVPRTVNMMARAIDTTDTIAVGSVRLPMVTSVEESDARMPPPFRPMNATNRPMPIPMAWRSATGMASITASRKPSMTSTKMMTPSKNTTPMAMRQSSPIDPHSVKATMALMPIPDASAMGRLAIRPMAAVMTAAPKHVAVSAALNGMPAASIMAGLTATI